MNGDPWPTDYGLYSANWVLLFLHNNALSFSVIAQLVSLSKISRVLTTASRWRLVA
jgi:hypothetical protein